MNEELKPCPFCGKHNLASFLTDNWGTIVYCIDCYENTSNNCTARADALDWNTRPIEDELRVELE